LQFSCLSLLSVGITDVCHHALHWVLSVFQVHLLSDISSTSTFSPLDDFPFCFLNGFVRVQVLNFCLDCICCYFLWFRTFVSYLSKKSLSIPRISFLIFYIRIYDSFQAIFCQCYEKKVILTVPYHMWKSLSVFIHLSVTFCQNQCLFQNGPHCRSSSGLLYTSIIAVALQQVLKSNSAEPLLLFLLFFFWKLFSLLYFPLIAYTF
jgi:hypothetical protein